MSVTANSARSNWLVFIALGFFWGSSYLFIKIGVDSGLTPFTLVTLRLLVGTILLGVVIAISREKLPRDLRMYLNIAILAVFAIALPFVLITIAEQHTPSALAATLTAPVPLFTVLFAAPMLGDRITAAKLVGVVVGLIGVAVLMGFDPSQLGQTDLTYQLVLVAAAISYGFGAAFARKYVVGLRPMVPAFVEVASAMLMVAVCAFVFENPLSLVGTLPADAIFSVLWLGFFGSGLAYLAFFRLIGAWGATRTTMVAYLLPVWGIALGFFVLNEPIQSGLVLGTLLIIAGIAFVNTDRQTVGSLASRLRGVLSIPESVGDQR
ncbi:MAG TPA: DMT family transporter [Candidatus Limnocylindrales bacterium]|jgi:drug/metabolite transporter (DMT)-like permease